MRFFFGLCCLILIVATSSCRKSMEVLETSPLVQLPPPGYTLVWSDEFDKDSLDLDKWVHRAPGNRREGFNSPEAVYIDTNEKNLVIESFLRNDTAFTGMIATRGRYHETYGYFECRAKVSHIFPGYWAAFWIHSMDFGKTLDPAVSGMEIDVMEFVGGSPHHINHALHWNGYGLNLQSKTSETFSNKRLDEGFHLYSLEWTPEYYRFYVDKKLVWEVFEPISNKDQYMILSAEIADKAYFKEKLKEGRPIRFEVDYIRVYKKGIE